MSPQTTLPQEWPNHLYEDAVTQPATEVPPNGSHVLNFTGLQPLGFEQFCWWLLRKHHRLVGCKRLGGPGLAQGGIDLLAFDETAPDKLIVFECKSGQGFSARDLTSTVKNFVDGPWISSTREFYLILAKHEVEPPLAERWKQVKKELHEKGIHGVLWTAHTLTAMVQGHPDVLSKFFPTYSLEFFGNKWMQRVAFYDAFSKAFFDPRETVRTLAKAVAQQGELVALSPTDAKPTESSHAASVSDHDGEDVRKFVRHGYGWSYKGPWFSIDAFLPGPEFSNPSAAIQFNIENLTGLTLALSGRWLHDNMLFATGAPITHEHRGFIVGPALHLPGQVIDLSSARLRLPDEVVEELAGVADALTADVHAAYLALETKWGATGFPFVPWSGDHVAIGAINRRAWNAIMAFAREHDFNVGNGQWNLFDAAHNVLKPYVLRPERHGGRFDRGYHGIFYASADVDVTLFDDELAILWQPPDRYSGDEISERAWWTCEFAQRWLINELLPEVRRWVLQKEFPSWISRVTRRKAMSGFEDMLLRLITLRDLRTLPLLQEERIAMPTIDAVKCLQSFFNAAKGSPHVFVNTVVVEALYSALAVLARLGFGHIPYVASNLSLSGSPETHAELEKAILSRVREHMVVANIFVVDCALRAALELLPDDGTPIPPPVNDVLRDALVPLARIHDNAQLARRHQPPIR